MRRRVVVTGIGVVTPVGNTVDEVFANLMAGSSGVRPTTRFDTSRNPVKTAGEVPDFDPADHEIGPRDIRILGRHQQFVLAASQQAAADAGLDLPRNQISSTRRSERRFDDYGAAIGVAFTATEGLAEEYERLKDKGTRGVSPRLFNMTMPNVCTSVVSIRHGLCGPSVTVSSASASGADALIEAYDQVRHGRAAVMLAGGAEAPITDLIVSGFARNHTGATSGVCRPFDADRDGTVLGEGAAVMVLEERDHALARGARIHGEVLGYGRRADAYDLSDIPPTDAVGMASSLMEALTDAQVDANDVGYVNVHGTATKRNDPAEAYALRKVFGPHVEHLRVSGIKGATGHMLGGSGALEAVVALVASIRHQVPPTYGLRRPDPDCELHHVQDVGADAPVPVAITTSVGLGGSNSAIVLAGSDRWGR